MIKSLVFIVWLNARFTVFFPFLDTLSGGDTEVITPPQYQGKISEGSNVTLSCTFMAYLSEDNINATGKIVL